jgi:succinate dehydrogenase / fumarate reductase membrane anchor subunit
MSQWRRNDPLNRDIAGGHASPLRRAIGLGSAKFGAEHWWLQRVTAVALIPLAVWFMAGLIAHGGDGPAAVSTWLAHPWIALPMILLMVTLFQHTRLGLQVIIEDYVHSDRLKFALVAAIHASCYGLMAVGIFAVLVIVFR